LTALPPLKFADAQREGWMGSWWRNCAVYGKYIGCGAAGCTLWYIARYGRLGVCCLFRRPHQGQGLLLVCELFIISCVVSFFLFSPFLFIKRLSSFFCFFSRREQGLQLSYLSCLLRLCFWCWIIFWDFPSVRHRVLSGGRSTGREI
jgi:hypothetical protein